MTYLDFLYITPMFSASYIPFILFIIENEKIRLEDP